MVRSESGQIVYFTIDQNPTILGGGVLGQLLNGDFRSHDFAVKMYRRRLEYSVEAGQHAKLHSKIRVRNVDR